MFFSFEHEKHLLVTRFSIDGFTQLFMRTIEIIDLLIPQTKILRLNQVIHSWFSTVERILMRQRKRRWKLNLDETKKNESRDSDKKRCTSLDLLCFRRQRGSAHLQKRKWVQSNFNLFYSTKYIHSW